MVRSIFYRLVIIAVAGFIFTAGDVVAFDAESFISNFENRNDQEVLAGYIDSLAIIRGNAEFYLTDGELTLFDFGWDRPSAIYFSGKCRFIFTPPDEIERRQLMKFTKKETMDIKLDEIILFFSVDLNIPDTSSFTRTKIDKKIWRKVVKARRDIYYHMDIYITNKILNDLVSENEGTFFCADLNYKSHKHYIFIEDPFPSDLYRLVRYIMVRGNKTYEVYSSYDPESSMLKKTGPPISIYHYDLNARIETNGNMTVKSRIHYYSKHTGRRFLQFKWFHKNKVISAFDSNGEPIKVVTRDEPFRLLESVTEEHGFGLVLNNATIKGEANYVDIEFDCGTVQNVLGRYYFNGQTDWYPKNVVRSGSTFKLTFDYPSNIQVIAGGNRVKSVTEKDRTTSEWLINEPVEYVSFNVGNFAMLDISDEGILPVKIYLYHTDLLQNVGADIVNSLNFFSKTFGHCPFDTLKVVETPYAFTRHSHRLIHLSEATFTDEDLQGLHEQYRARYVAAQWWRHLVGFKTYRDLWIIEGLSDYCGLWFYELLSQDHNATNNMLTNMRKNIYAGSHRAGSAGSKAGSVVLGYRLRSTKSNDYDTIIRKKSAYLFHMIRYMFHDFSTGSDDQFVAFLRDIIENCKKASIDNQMLKTMLEKHFGDMNWFINQWVYGTDIPEYQFDYQTSKVAEGKYQVTCYVKQEGVSEDFKMSIPITVRFDNNRLVHLKLLIDKPEKEIKLPILPLEPKDIEFNTHNAVLCIVK